MRTTRENKKKHLRQKSLKNLRRIFWNNRRQIFLTESRKISWENLRMMFRGFPRNLSGISSIVLCRIFFSAIVFFVILQELLRKFYLRFSQDFLCYCSFWETGIRSNISSEIPQFSKKSLLAPSWIMVGILRGIR